MEHALLYISLACLFGILLTWGIGANDLANIMSTTIGSKAVSPAQAVLIAIVFEFAGALFGSGQVSHTISNGIIDAQLFAMTPHIYICGMLSVLLAGSTWMLIASYLGLPVSVTNAIIGAIVGFGCVVLGPKAIYWPNVIQIAVTWLTSPLIAAVTAYASFRCVQFTILSTNRPAYYAKRYVPIYLFLVGTILAHMIVLKALENMHLAIDLAAFKILIMLGTGLIVMLLGMLAIQRIRVDVKGTPQDRFAYVEKVFSILMAVTACMMVFAHGSNDVAIAAGPMIAVFSHIDNADTQVVSQYLSPQWLTILSCIGIIAGLLVSGRKVIATVGTSITSLLPSHAFAATIAAASTIVIATSLGIPVSATQTLVGAVLGVGLARGIGALNLQVIRNIFMSWIITIPVASILAVCFYYLLQTLIGI